MGLCWVPGVLGTGSLRTRSNSTTAEDSRSCRQYEHMLPHLDLLEWGPHSENMCIQLHPSNIDPWPNRAPDCPEDRGHTDSTL